MYATDNDRLLSHDSVEAPIDRVEDLSVEQQQRYLLQGAIAIVLVGLLSLVAIGIN